MTIAAEAQARSGHDILALPTWWAQAYASSMVPLDDIMEPLIKQNGAVNDTVTYLGKTNGKWVAVPATIGSQIKGPCSRIDLMKQHAGIDVQALYPAGSPPKADSWNFETYLKAAEACQKAGHAFGVGLGQTTDNVDTAGAFFNGFGAHLVNAKGDITVKTRHGAPGARVLRQGRRSSIRRTRRHGTTRRTTSGWCPAAARSS